jgi:hypothetical protein
VLTLELRWFVAAALDDRELEVFAEDGKVEVRVDDYLHGTGVDLGVKRRGPTALLEHKRCLERTPISLTVDGAVQLGTVERWHKTWPGRDSADPGSWTAVAKRRALRRIASCRAELTLLRVDPLAAVHSSLAIESTDVESLDSLLRSAETLLREHPSLAARFRGATSCGYPAWLL